MSSRAVDSKSDKKKRKLQEESPVSQDGSDDSVVEALLKQYESYKIQFDEWTTKNKGNVTQEAYDKYVDDFKSWEKVVLGQIKSANKKHRKAKKKEKKHSKSEKSRDLVEVQIASSANVANAADSTGAGAVPPVDPMAMMMTMAMMMMPMLAQQQAMQPMAMPVQQVNMAPPQRPMMATTTPVGSAQFGMPPMALAGNVPVQLPDLSRPPPMAMPVMPRMPSTTGGVQSSINTANQMKSNGGGRVVSPTRKHTNGSFDDRKFPKDDESWYKKNNDAVDQKQTRRFFPSRDAPPARTASSSMSNFAPSGSGAVAGAIMPPSMALTSNRLAPTRPVDRSMPPMTVALGPMSLGGPPPFMSLPGGANPVQLPPAALNPLAFRQGPPPNIQPGAGGAVPLRPLMDFGQEFSRGGGHRPDDRPRNGFQEDQQGRSKFGAKDFSMKRRDRRSFI